MLLLILVSICAISTASAVDDVAEIASADDTVDVAATDDVKVDELKNMDANQEKVDDNERLATSQDFSELSAENSDEILSQGPPSSLCSIKLESEYEISAHAKGSIKYYRTPSPSYMPYDAYHYFITAIDINGNVHYSKEIQGSNHDAGYYTHTVAKDSIRPGSYVLAFINYEDNAVLATSVLKVKGEATITPSDYNANYMSGAKMTARVTDKVNGQPLNALTIAVTFIQGKTRIVKSYTPDSNGYISFEPPVGVGTWSVQFAPGESHIKGSALKTITIKKSGVSIKASKVTEYKGFKAKLKATVKSYGRNVNEGKVVFKIKGKKYYANVKNGVATYSIKLNKIKKYKYSATYLGSKNLFKSKKSKAKVKMKKRLKVKIYAPNPTVYTGQVKHYTLKIKTTSGKKVKNGWVKVWSKKGYTTAPVKKGKVKVVAYGLLSDVYKGSNGVDSYYKKSVTKKFKIKYYPGSHKYKKAKTKYKATTKFKCHCGKKTTHRHSYWGYYYLHYYTIYVK